MENGKKNGGVQCRIGTNFYKAIEEIKDLRLRNGKSKDRVSSEKITNMIIRHADWKNIFNDMVNCPEESINIYGK